MNLDLVVVSSAFLIGVFASSHCALMCGGIAVSLSAGCGGGRAAALQLQLGRILGYSVAGALSSGFASSVITLLNWPQLGVILRALSGVFLLFAAARIAGWPTLERLLPASLSKRLENAVWRRMAPLRDRFWPKTQAANRSQRLVQRLAMGGLWAWLPCSLSFTLLKVAVLRADALEGGLLMAAFGLGTLPLMYGLSRTGSFARRAPARLAAALIALAGVLTLAMPWLSRRPELHGLLGHLGWCA